MGRPTWSMVGRRRSHLRQILSLLAIAVCLVGVATYLLARFMVQPRPTSLARPDSRLTAPPKAVSARSRVLFMGTTYWGRYTNRAAEKSGNKLSFPFEKLGSLDRKKYDAWVANLECPLSAKVNLTAEQEEETLSFNCSPDYLPEAAKWFDVFGSANNHSDNQGEAAFLETRQQLDKYKIQYFGHYDPEVISDVCEVVGVSFKVAYDRGSKKDLDLPIALCGFHGVFKIPSEDSLAVMKRYSQYMPVVAYPHAGAEYKAEPDQIKTDLYRSMIDHGADMVIGDHPHWVQATEVYKGKPIIYSMGNFMFDQQYNQEVVRSAAIDVIFEVQDESLDDWLKLESCRKFHDDCLDRVAETELKKLRYSFRYGVVPTENRGYQTKKAQGMDAAAIYERLGWDSLMNQLQAPYFSQ